MKFMLMLKNGATAPEYDEHVRLNRQVSSGLSDLLGSKKVECAYFVFPDRGMCILDVESHEELLGIIRNWPFYRYTTFEVYPLADARYAVESSYGSLMGAQPERG